MNELKLNIPLLAISKGTTRKPGLEKLYLNDDHQMISLPDDSKALHLLQQIRDEAHRFAITPNVNNVIVSEPLLYYNLYQGLVQREGERCYIIWWP